MAQKQHEFYYQEAFRRNPSSQGKRAAALYNQGLQQQLYYQQPPYTGFPPGSGRSTKSSYVGALSWPGKQKKRSKKTISAEAAAQQEAADNAPGATGGAVVDDIAAIEGDGNGQENRGARSSSVSNTAASEGHAHWKEGEAIEAGGLPQPGAGDHCADGLAVQRWQQHQAQLEEGRGEMQEKGQPREEQQQEPQRPGQEGFEPESLRSSEGAHEQSQEVQSQQQGAQSEARLFDRQFVHEGSGQHQQQYTLQSAGFYLTQEDGSGSASGSSFPTVNSLCFYRHDDGTFSEVCVRAYPHLRPVLQA